MEYWEGERVAELDKVIKAIECCIDEKHGCYNCEFKYTNGKVACRMFEESYNSIPTELIKNALELLKGQEAVTIKKTKEHGFGVYGGICPKCNNWIQSAHSFCGFCGQAVKWE